MIFTLKNIGAIKKAEIEIGNLTVIAGKNNTGKTYLTYSLWGSLSQQIPDISVDNLFNLIDKDNIIHQLNEGNEVEIDFKSLEKDFKEYFKEIIHAHSKKLHQVFNAAENFFENSLIEVDFKKYSFDYTKNYSGEIKKNGKCTFIYSKQKNPYVYICKIDKKDTNYSIFISDIKFFLSKIATQFFYQNIQIFTAQRDSIHFFKNAINEYNGELVRKYQYKEEIDKIDKYPIPLKKNIDFISSFSSLTATKSFLYDIENGLDILSDIENILGIKYEISLDSFMIESQNGIKTPSFLVSTSVRTLADLYFYLKHKAKKDDFIAIDEPEMNLHPEAQIKMAKLLVKLVNVGLKVWITTHSDYIIKELNNCLLLSNKIRNKQKLIEELGYKENEILQKKDIRYYTTQYDQNLKGCITIRSKITKFGIEAPSFDETLENIVNKSNKILEAIN